VFHLDAGETLLKGFFSNKDDTSKERALLIGELSKDVGVDVWTVGPSDVIAVGMETLQTMPGPPRISATWKNEAGVPYFDPFTILEKDSIQLAVIGLSTHPTDPRFQFIQTTPAKAALTEVLPTIPATVDMIVALGSMDDDEVDNLRQEFPQLSMILTTEGATFEEADHTATYTQIIEAPKQGRFLQNIHIRQTQLF
jgi:2',3'-cyclic-nucleotide 2'-phosphodiesterase (5'-nucleotidase family)